MKDKSKKLVLSSLVILMCLVLITLSTFALYTDTILIRYNKVTPFFGTEQQQLSFDYVKESMATELANELIEKNIFQIVFLFSDSFFTFDFFSNFTYFHHLQPCYNSPKFLLIFLFLLTIPQ